MSKARKLAELVDGTADKLIGYDSNGDVAEKTPLVSSVNGATGAVTVSVPVSSVNGETGAVTVSVPVSSVNGQTGAVTVQETDTTPLENASAFLSMKMATQNSMTKFNMIDQVIDTFTDSSGVDAGASTNESLTSGYYCGGTTVSGPSIDSYVKLLIQSNNATNNSTTFTDLSSSNKTITRFGSTMKHDTAYGHFGTSSINFNGSDDYLRLANHADWNFGTGDWTMEIWWKPISGSDPMDQFGMGQHIGSGNGNPRDVWHAHYNGSWYYSYDEWHSANETAWSSIIDSNFHHQAIVRSGGTVYHLRDGIMKYSSSEVYGNGQNNQFYVGNSQSSSAQPIRFKGYLEEVVVSKGIARYTADYSVPQALYGQTALAINDLTMQSTSTTAESTPTTGDFVTLVEDGAGTATLNTDIKGYVSRDNGTTWTQGTLIDEGDWGANKRILAFHNLDISSQPAGTSMKYKITTHNQSASKETRIHATSLAWA